MLLVLSASSLVVCTNDRPALSPGPEASTPPAERSCPRVAESTVTGTVADSGNDAAVYALEPTGEVVAEVTVDGATNEDWVWIVRRPRSTFGGS
jgi:hypothetical protein